MDFLGTYLIDENTSDQNEEKQKPKIDVSHYPSPKGLEQFTRVHEETNVKDARNRLKPLFLSLPKNDQDDDFDHGPIPTVASDLLTPITTDRGSFKQALDFYPPFSSNTPINAIDSMRTVFLTPRNGVRSKRDIEKKLGETSTKRNEAQDESEGNVDSGPIQSMFDYFKLDN